MAPQILFRALVFALFFPRGIACFATGPVDWKATGTLAAPEAVQAAAADERFVYVVENRKIAKYDRATGQRLGESVGPAEHLNSGYFHEGKLLCAHSNYPKTPERSEILVLEPESMRLGTFKDFGNYGGSLTWVLHREGNWWCNFAHYGESNGNSFLARFNNDWKETGRWSYPSELLRELGRYSLSGGVWRGDTLLVTGHDDPVLFELRVPEKGNVLELVGRHSVPFSGQGIAHDPVTGGLVGIQRKPRMVLFASPAKDRN